MESLPNLHDVYLLALQGFAAAIRQDVLLQDLGEGNGRLWLVPQNSTVPTAQIAFKFGVDGVQLGILTRDEREFTKFVKFSEGLDGFLEQAQKFFDAGLLPAPSSVRRIRGAR
jgi:hypothetical protein